MGHAAASGIVYWFNEHKDENNSSEMLNDDYDNNNDNNNNTKYDNHPCANLWQQFQTCMNMNSSQISSCQHLYHQFNKCQVNPNSYVRNSFLYKINL